MESVIELLNPYLIYIVLGLVGVSFILLIMMVLTLSKLKKMQKKYQSFMIKEDVDVEQLLMHYAQQVKDTTVKQDQLDEKINRLDEALKYCTQKVGVVRYNAIEKVGADLSFAIAMLDAQDNGIVLNGIYSRDGSYVYSKPVTNGQSTYQLSDEEKEAIRLAKENNKASV